MDAAISRSEAFHHLKTLAETYIYFHWVGRETDDKRAKILTAKELRSKVKLYNANPEFDPEKEARNRFELMIKAWTNGVESEWKNFKDADLYRIAKDTNSTIVGWYNRVYRPACEPAHMTVCQNLCPWTVYRLT